MSLEREKGEAGEEMFIADISDNRNEPAAQMFHNVTING